VGVGIDLDHFLIARVNAGDWSAVRRCLRRPRIVFVEQEAIFETLDVLVLERLLSHVVIGGVVVLGLALASPYLAGVTAAVLYAHLLADLIWDNRRFEATARRYVRALDDARSESARRERSGRNEA
jgi:hypothetical protein